MSYCIDQRKIPGISRLYADYLYAFPRVAPFYASAAAPFAMNGLEGSAAEVRYPEARREVVARCLEQQNSDYGMTATTRELLGRFRQPDCVAIVTGQQVGLFGGPLLALHKAATAIRLARRLQRAGQNAVPIFWLASQDHDLEEINHAYALDMESRPVRIATASRGAGGAPVGRIRLGEAIAGAIAEWAEVTGRNPAELDDLHACYRPEETFATAWAKLFTRWFAPWGLILLDPQHPDYQREIGDLYRQALDRHEELAAALEARNEALVRAGYHVQVGLATGASLLFIEQDGAREPVRARQGRWTAGETPIAEAELYRRLHEEPERFSPAALLRPITQDALLPVAAQVAGPAETAYLAQSACLYPLLGVRKPVVYPRVSATLLDARAQRLLDKYGIGVEAVWHEPLGDDPVEGVAALLSRRALPADWDRRFQEFETMVARDIGELTERIRALDPTLIDFAQAAGGKIRYQVEQIGTRVARSLGRKREDLPRHAQHLSGTLYPQRHLQERLLSAADWIERRGPDLVAKIVESVSPECPDHQVIEV